MQLTLNVEDPQHSGVASQVTLAPGTSMNAVSEELYTRHPRAEQGHSVGVPIPATISVEIMLAWDPLMVGPIYQSCDGS